MKLISDILDISQTIFVWASFICAILIFTKSVDNIAKNQKNIKSWIIAMINFIFLISFLVAKIFYTEMFELVFGILFWFVVIFSTQWSKYEDRKSGKRWWTQ